MNKQTGIFIPARINSERLPNKIILPFGESCLFDIACKKLSNLPNDINKYVLIYDEILIKIAKQYKNINIIQRDQQTVIAETPLNFIFKDMESVTDTHLMFLNPCLAFLSSKTILDSIKYFNTSDADYGTSVKKFQNWLMTQDGIMINDINYKELTTKKITPLLQTAHCFHIFDKKQFFIDGYMLKDGFLPIPVSERETIDVDTLDEYDYARWKYEKDLRSRFRRDIMY